MAKRSDTYTLEEIRLQKAILNEQIIKQKNVLRRKTRAMARSLSESPFSASGLLSPISILGLGKFSTLGMGIFKGIKFGLKILKVLRKAFR